MKVQFTNTFDGTESFSIASNLPSIVGSSSQQQASKSLFAAGFSDGSLKIWDFDQLVRGDGATLDRPLHTVEDVFQIGPVDVKLSPDGTKVAVSSVDNSLKVYSLQEEESKQNRVELLCEAPADVAEAWKIDFNADGSQILTGQLSLSTLSIVKEASGTSALTKDADKLAVNQKLLHSISYSRNGELAAAGDIDGSVHLYDMKTRQFKARFANHNLAVRALAFDRTATSLISAGQDLHCFVSDVETQQRLQTLVGHADWITDIAPHPLNRDVFLTASLDHSVKVWSTKSHKQINSLDLGSPVWGLAYSPCGDFFAAVAENGTISLINCKQLTLSN